jgi:hypothetical protein
MWLSLTDIVFSQGENGLEGKTDLRRFVPSIGCGGPRELLVFV